MTSKEIIAPDCACVALIEPQSISQLATSQTNIDLESIRQAFYLHGVSVSKWAKERGFNRSLVKDVLNGRVVGKYGKAYEIAIALGIKKAPRSKPLFLEKGDHHD